jgi:hypothetical protein
VQIFMRKLVSRRRKAADAANRQSNTLGCFLDDWEAKHGELTPEELASATKELTRPPKKVGAIDSTAMQDFNTAALHASPAGAAPGVDITDADRDGTSRSSSS